ncbi:MAG: hypothetical protein JNK29_10850 [Anaerolineales bacterium]|nr:hypothetical protein [Anaerolineales bacterium]
MAPDEAPVPAWLWRSVTWGVGLLTLAVAGLALALALGAADPPRAGPLAWQDDFKQPNDRWDWRAAEGAALAPRAGALVADFSGPGQWAAALAEAPAGVLTLEIAGAQTEGAGGAAGYGLVFNWASSADYAAVLVNGHGYVEAFQQTPAGRRDWYPFQQWPHILYGTESNRVRVDVRGRRVTARINDEVLAVFEAAGAGRVGVLARSSGPARVVFSWVRVWAAP